MLKKIEAYLNGTLSYMDGCSVFLSISNNRQFALRLMSNETEVNIQTLKYELTKYLQSQPNYWQSVVAGVPYSEFINPIETHSEQKQPTNNLTQPYTSTSYSQQQEDDGIHNKVLEQRNALMRERGHFHGQLHIAKTKEERFEIASKLMSLQSSIDSLNLDLQNLKGGAIPVRFLQKTLSADEYKRIENIKRYISRERKKLSEAKTPSEADKIRARLFKFEEELKKYGKEI